MSMNNRKIAGFMSAESIYSLAFYIIMVAAIAGIGAGIMSKSAAAKGATALSILRANYQVDVSMSGYAAASPVAADLDKFSAGLLSGGVLPGVGTFSVVNQPTNGPRNFVINVVGVSNTDVCLALTSTGFGSWIAMGVAPSALAASNGGTSSAPGSSAVLGATSGSISSGGTVTKGLLTTKAAAKAACENIYAAPAGTALAFISN